MKNLWLIALLLAPPAVPQSAQDHEFPSTSGNAFLRLCSAIDKEDQSSHEAIAVTACLGYVDGFTEGVALERLYAGSKEKQKPSAPFCIPEDVENGQMVRIVLKYVRDNPTDAHMSTSLLMMDALGKAYPCPGK
jgi:hypothetical protein